MSDLSYKELQERGVFDIPYKAFQFMQEQQARIDELEERIEKALGICEVNKNIESERTTHYSEGFESGAYTCAFNVEKALRGEE